MGTREPRWAGCEGCRPCRLPRLVPTCRAAVPALRRRLRDRHFPRPAGASVADGGSQVQPLACSPLLPHPPVLPCTGPAPRPSVHTGLGNPSFPLLGPRPGAAAWGAGAAGGGPVPARRLLSAHWASRLLWGWGTLPCPAWSTHLASPGRSPSPARLGVCNPAPLPVVFLQKLLAVEDTGIAGEGLEVPSPDLEEVERYGSQPGQGGAGRAVPLVPWPRQLPQGLAPSLHQALAAGLGPGLLRCYTSGAGLLQPGSCPEPARGSQGQAWGWVSAVAAPLARHGPR